MPHTHHPPPPPKAARLTVTWRYIRKRHHRFGFFERLFEYIFEFDTFQNVNNTKGENNKMLLLVPGQIAYGLWSPLDSNGNPSKAALSGPSFTSSDPTVFSVAVDPANPTNGCIVTALTPATLPDSAVVNAQATATEADGSSEQISGSDTVTVNPATPPPPPTPKAASLSVAWTPGPVPASAAPATPASGS